MTAVLPRLLRALDRFHATHPWDHNAHYHRWILRRLPSRFAGALDVGSGSGDLARLLATRAEVVHGIDADPAIVERARERTGTGAPVTFFVGDALKDVPAGPYDVITCVATIHHMPLTDALTRFREHLAPGGDPDRRRPLPHTVPERPPDRRRRHSVEHRHGLDQEQGPQGAAPRRHDRTDPTGDHGLSGHRSRRPPRAARRAAAPTAVLALHVGLESVSTFTDHGEGLPALIGAEGLPGGWCATGGGEPGRAPGRPARARPPRGPGSTSPATPECPAPGD